MSRFKTVRLRWWNLPVPLYKRGSVDENGHAKWIRVGWVWNQKARLVNNIYEGWIAFVEDQTEENLEIWNCEHCGVSATYMKQGKIKDYLMNNH